MSEQTVQTQIRLLLNWKTDQSDQVLQYKWHQTLNSADPDWQQQSDQGLHYLPFLQHLLEASVTAVIMPRHQKVARYYVIPSEILSVRPSVCPSVRPSVSAHHHSCIGNSSYSFRPILLKLYRCFKDGLKICILFFQNPEIIFYHFFPIFNLDIFRALIVQICIWSMYLVSATPPTVFGESFWNFTGVLRMVWRYAYCFFRILKLFFITFFAFLT